MVFTWLLKNKCQSNFPDQSQQFGFASHWLKNWGGAAFGPITRCCNLGGVISFESHLKTLRTHLTQSFPFHILTLANHSCQELESLKTELEESIDTTTAAQDMRNKRESELAALKKSVEEETTAHEAAMGQLRQKHAQLVEELNVQLETTKKVWHKMLGWQVKISRPFSWTTAGWKCFIKSKVTTLWVVLIQFLPALAQNGLDRKGLNLENDERFEVWTSYSKNHRG